MLGWRVVETAAVVAATLAGALLVGAALVDIIWRDEPDLFLEWSVVAVAGFLVIVTVAGAVFRGYRSGADHRNPGKAE